MALPQIGIEAVLKDDNFKKGLANYQKGLGDMEQSSHKTAGVLSSLGSVASGALTLGIGAAAAAFGAFTVASAKGLGELSKWGEQLDKLGDQFGFTGEQAAGFTFLANKVGLSVDEMGFGLNTITRELKGMADDLKAGKQPTSEFSKGLKQLGVNAFDAKGKVKSFDVILPQIMDAFKKLPAGVNASALAMQLFGARGGSKFLDFLRQGSEGLDEAYEKAQAFGLSLTTDQVNAIEEFGFAQNELKLAMQGAWSQIGLAVMPVAQEIVKFLNENAMTAIWGLRDMLDKIGKGDWEGIRKDVEAGIKLVADEILKQIKAVDWEAIAKASWRWIEDAADMAGNELVVWLNAFEDWANSGTTQDELRRVGSEVGSGLVDGVVGLLGRADTRSGIGNAIVNALKGAIDAIPQVIADIGAGIAEGVISGIYRRLSGQDIAENIKYQMRAIFSAAIQDIGEFASSLMNPFKMFQYMTSGLPGFAVGGIVPGAMGRPQLAVVHGGERIIPTNSSAAYGGRTSISNVTNRTSGVSVIVRGSVYGVADLQATIRQAIHQSDRGL